MKTDPVADMLSEGDPITDDQINQTRETVIVTGSSGLIGYRVCERLLSSYNVIGFDRAGIPHPPPATDKMDVDLTSEESIHSALQTVKQRYGNKIASVIHLAAFYDFSGKPSPQYDEITVRGTAKLLRFLKPFQVEQFIFSSTMLIHAPCYPGERINEEWPLDPKWDYPRSKAKTENVIRLERGKVPAVFLRIAGVYNEECHSIPLAHQIQRIYERTLTGHLFPGNVNHGQSFIHLEDVVEMVASLVSRRQHLPKEMALLAGEQTTLSYDALQKAFARLIHGTDWKTYHIPKNIAKVGAWLQGIVPGMRDPFIKPWMIDLADDHYELDILKAKKLLGWAPRYSLRSSLSTMIDEFRKDIPAWYQKNNLKPPRHWKQTTPPPQPHAQKDPEKELAGAAGGAQRYR